MIIATPASILYDTYHIPDEPQFEYCHPVDSDLDRIYTLVKAVLLFILPLLIIFVAYTGKVLWKIISLKIRYILEIQIYKFLKI